VVGWLNDQVFTTPDGVRYSLVAVAAVGAAALTLYFATGRRAYAESVARLEAAQLRQGMAA
jgi:hypothetical protein